MTGASAPGIGRQAAQRLARAELSKAMYHHSPSLVERVLADIGRWLSRLHSLASQAPGGWWAIVALAAIAVIATVAVLNWVGPVQRTRRGRLDLAPSSQIRAARDHRLLAERLAEASDHTGAIRESLRAVAAELDERGIVPARQGWTAHEFAEQAARILPAHGSELRAAAGLFDEVCYGDRPGTAEGYERLRALDAALIAGAGRTRPVAGQMDPAAVGGHAS